MARLTHERGLVRIGLSETSRAILLGQESLGERDSTVVEEVASFRFLGATIVWLDLAYSVTAGSSPFSWPFTFFSAGSDCQIQLQGIMGCQNWALVQIGRNAALQSRKTKGWVGGVKLKQMVGDIEAGIQQGLARHAMGALKLSDSVHAMSCGGTWDPTAITTYIFAHTARIHLHLVACGFQELQAVEDSVVKAMDALRADIVQPFRSALIIPLFICGITATPQDRDFFRNVFSSPPLRHPSLQHREKILPALEKIWWGRDTTSPCTWDDSLRLTNDILLY